MKKDIAELRQKYSGERAFLLGNGPSLDNTPLKKLTDEYTFATNRISKIYSDTDWRAKIYLNTRNSINEIGLRHAREAIEKADLSIVSSENQELFSDLNSVYSVNRIQVHDEEYDCLSNPSVPERRKKLWSDDLSEIIYWYNTSFYPMYQAANYMGFNEIYLLGCDLGMDSTNHLIFQNATDPYLFYKEHKKNNNLTIYLKFLRDSDETIKSLINGLYLKGRQNISTMIPKLQLGKDVHFGERYLDSPQIRRGTDDKQRRAHQLAKSKLAERDVSIKNATIGGELEVFPRVDINDVL